jgi:hypothetical protein
MVADDYFFPAEASGAITVAALSLVREKAA